MVSRSGFKREMTGCHLGGMWEAACQCNEEFTVSSSSMFQSKQQITQYNQCVSFPLFAGIRAIPSCKVKMQ